MREPSEDPPTRTRFESIETEGQADDWQRDIEAWQRRGVSSTPYMALPIAEPHCTLSTLFRPRKPEPPRVRTDYVRETLHPNDPEFRARAIEWGRRERESEVAYNTGGNGTVIALGFERHSNEAMRERFAAIERAEQERRRREDERICWCEDGPPECWPDEAAAGWCDVGAGGWCAEVSLSIWPEDDTWGWCDSESEGWSDDERVCWCLDEGGGWIELSEAWCDDEDLQR